jgi:cytochrome oxidase Cu insertion factor (SCO1/SenC/PrrC family)
MNFKSQTLSNGGIAMKRPAVVVFVLVILLLWKIPGASAQTQFVEAGVEKFRVPVEAPDFTLTEVGEGKVSLKELRGKIILLNFFASW